MRAYISSALFEIVNGALVFRGGDYRPEYKHKEKTPQLLCLGETGILLGLVDGKPQLTVPEGQNAELLQSDYAFKDTEDIQRIEGKFVEVRIR